ncbi:MAG TPA: hypothetical protein ENN34_04735 [Deltaproteobacteria bacterium]|nr:hypothetical protein [Deltaproteobacteria bacterium]
MQISQRKILITGAASGIDRAAALTMGNQGVTLFPLYHLIMRLATRAMDRALTRTSRGCS